MLKTKQRRNKQFTRKTKKSRKSRKLIKIFRRCKRCKSGGEDEKVTCCMCEKEVNKNNTLIPRVCLNLHGAKAHRICSECWWDPKTGFARENAPHGCPGCAKNFPLTKLQFKKPELLDLTLEDE